ncbi:MAG: outer membrane protein assembly factor BamA [Burkholderiaceae bacterium]|nr:outer membrane protein assembly factor BamA [Burkholderiaceae bacterium]
MFFLPQSTPLRPLAAAAALVMCLGAPAAHAVEPFVLKDIRVEGLQRTDAGTVFAALPFRIGDTYTDDKGASALRSLFGLGLFKDVRIDIEGAVAVIIVEERPVIQTVSFVGLKEFDKDALVKSLKDAGIGEGLPFDRALIDRAEQEIKRQYLSRSLYGAEVVTTVTPVERNRVNVTFTMTEGEAARIGEIRILGSKAFTEGTLLGLMELTTSGWLTWYTKNDRYSRAKLNADLETIRSYYLNRGYLEFAIESTQVTISPDKQDISITITIDEGQPYTVTAVRLQGEFLGKDDEFKELVRIRPGGPYRAIDTTETTKAFTDRFAIYGYAFARVEAQPEVDRATGQVAITLRADPQRRVYVRRIDVSGNTRTRDEVIRREFRQFESSWYDGQKIKLSRERVERLGYFKEVNVETNEVAGSPDQVDLVINVIEKPTGNLALGLTFSTTEKLSLSASVKQDNVFGSGNYLGFEINTSKYSRALVLSTVDPYFTIDGISRAFDVYYRTSRPLNSLGDEYQLATPGAAVRFGVPFSEYDTVFFGIGAEQTEIRGTNSIPNAYFIYRDLYGPRSNAFPLTLGWARDARDSVLTPTAGRYQRVNLEWGAFGDVRYLRTNFQYQEYFPLTTRFSLGINAELGIGRGLGDRPFPIFKNFYGGGLGSVRVFEQSSLGVIDPTGAYIGGAKKFNLNAELYIPVPGTGNDKSLRFFGFADTGNVWREGEPVRADDLRASAGLGLSWISPVGPLKMSWGRPLRSKPTDRIQKFQFQIGTAF